MKPEEVIDLCSESSDDERETFSLAKAITNGTIRNAAASTPDRQRCSKRPKLKGDPPSNAPAALPSLTLHTTNKAPLFFLKADDTATLTMISADECSRCFAKPYASGNIWLFAQTKQPQQMIHIQQQDRWSCGFRNFQMMLCFLIPRLLPDHSFFQSPVAPEVSPDYYQVPSVRDLQTTMELSWEQGFDTNGAQHYHHKIVGKSAWIGALEVSSCLSFMGIDSIVIQFIKCPESRQELGPFCLRYFSSGKGTSCSTCKAYQSAQTTATGLLRRSCNDGSCKCGSKLPLYLQWEGHSVTVIGVEETPKSKNLLVLNPAKTGKVVEKAIRSKKITPLRISFSQLHKKDTQILLPSFRSLSPFEQVQLKGNALALTAAYEQVQRAITLKT